MCFLSLECFAQLIYEYFVIFFLNFLNNMFDQRVRAYLVLIINLVFYCSRGNLNVGELLIMQGLIIDSRQFGIFKYSYHCLHHLYKLLEADIKIANMQKEGNEVIQKATISVTIRHQYICLCFIARRSHGWVGVVNKERFSFFLTLGKF